MALDISRALREPGEMIPFEETSPVALDRDDLANIGSATMYGHMTGIGESVAVIGEVSVSGTATCARCLATFPVTIHARLEETFVRKGNLQEQAEEDEETDDYPFQGEVIDLVPAAESALHLGMPMRFLCKKDCKGLCPVCGADRNQADCGCDTTGEDNPFAVLRALTQDEDSSDE